MSHFAKVINNLVVDVIVAEQDVIDSGLFGNPNDWIQTSFNTRRYQHPEGRPLRGTFAGIGYSYDKEKDIFIPPQPYPSWILDMGILEWKPPIPFPDELRNNGKTYYWDEDSLSYKERLVNSTTPTEQTA